jgi:capsular polysaccharide biosynthesis protein
MNYPVDGFIEGPGLLQSIWRYKWLVGGLVLLGILSASLLSATQPTRYEAVVPIFLTADEAAANSPERMVMNHAQFIESPSVSDRVIALTGNRLTRKELERRLTVEPSADGDFITIRARDTTPRNAAELADAVELAYRQILSEQRKADAKGTIAGLEGVQRTLASELAQIKKQRRTVDSPALQAEEKAKKRQMDATANKIERISADTAGTGISPPALENKPAVSDDPVQPKPLRAAAIGAVVGLVIGVALAWVLAARRRMRPSEETAKSQAHVVDDRTRPVEGSYDLAAASGIQESSKRVGRQLADVEDDRAGESVGQAVGSLDKDPDLLYSLAEWLESQHQNFPQITAERLRDRLLSDRVAVMLNMDDGLDLAGCVGWRPDGVRPVGQDDPAILNKLGADGARRIEPGERDELLKAGLLRGEDQTVVVAPLKHENVVFGVLLVGQDGSDTNAPSSGNGSFDGIGSFARSVAPDLHAWLLLHKLREQLASHGKAHDKTMSPAGSEPLTAVSEPPSEFEQLSAESVPPAGKSVPPAAEFVPSAGSVQPATEFVPSAGSVQPATEFVPSAGSVQPATESVPSAGSIPPSATSEPPATEAEPPSEESEPAPVWPTYPSGSGPSSGANDQPASSVDQQNDHQVRPSQSYRSKRVRGVSRR